jgi:hypothetical protein
MANPDSTRPRFFRAAAAAKTRLPYPAPARLALPLAQRPPICRPLLEMRHLAACNGRVERGWKSHPLEVAPKIPTIGKTASRHRMKRRGVLLHPPNSGVKSGHGAPVRKIQKTALTNFRLPLAIPPHVPRLPGSAVRFSPASHPGIVAVECAVLMGLMACIHTVCFYENRRELRQQSRDCTI